MLKFDVKLVVVVKIFKITAVRRLFFFETIISLLVPKVSFNFVYIFRVHRLCIYVLIHRMSAIFLRVSKFDVKLGVEVKNSKLKEVDDFSFLGSKSSLLVSKESFNFVDTFMVHRSCIHVPIHVIEIVTNIRMDFKI